MKAAAYDRARADTLARALTRLTGDQWKAKTHGEHYQQEESTFFNGDWYLENLTRDFTICLDYDRGRYRIRGIKPANLRGNDATIYNHPGNKDISVSASRTPQAVAADIARRLLPDFSNYVLACQAKVKQQQAIDAHFEQIGQTIQHAAPWLKAYGTNGDARGRMYNTTGADRVDLDFYSYSTHDGYKLKIDTQNIETVLKILAIVGETV